jgi:hypothetical protein
MAFLYFTKKNNIIRAENILWESKEWNSLSEFKKTIK